MKNLWSGRPWINDLEARRPQTRVRLAACLHDVSLGPWALRAAPATKVERLLRVAAQAGAPAIPGVLGGLRRAGCGTAFCAVSRTGVS
jgi:hypothetical protein